jgi:hypothetical protein
MDAVQGAVARESGQMMDKLAFVEGKVGAVDVRGLLAERRLGSRTGAKFV